MKVNKLSVLLMILIFSTSTITAQEDRAITIGDTSIFAYDVDINIGYTFFSKEEPHFYRKPNAIPVYLIMAKTLYVSPESGNYAILLDSTFYWNYDAVYASELTYYDKQGNVLFTRYFDYGVNNVSISASGKVLLVRLSSEEIQLFDEDGKYMKTYGVQYANLYKDNKHKYFFIKQKDNHEHDNVFDLINKNGEIDEVIFPDGYLTYLRFSPESHYYLVTIDSYRLLYNIENEFLYKWSEKDDGSVGFYCNDSLYTIFKLQNSAFEIRNLLSKELIFSANHVMYNDTLFPISRIKKIDCDFYLVGETQDDFIFNFYHDNLLIQTEKRSISHSFLSDFKISKDKDCGHYSIINMNTINQINK